MRNAAGHSTRAWSTASSRTSPTKASPGWQAALQFKPDLVLLDVMMPGETHGLDLCLALKVEPMLAATRVIMLSARGTHADREAGLRAGADAYLVKPFSPMQLLALVDDETVAA